MYTKHRKKDSFETFLKYMYVQQICAKTVLNYKIVQRQNNRIGVHEFSAELLVSWKNSSEFHLSLP